MKALSTAVADFHGHSHPGCVGPERSANLGFYISNFRRLKNSAEQKPHSCSDIAGYYAFCSPGCFSGMQFVFDFDLPGWGHVLWAARTMQQFERSIVPARHCFGESFVN